MKILVFHQPFPMGNYKLNQMVANRLQQSGHKVYLLQQLNGVPAPKEYIESLKVENFDIIYYEMLDAETFKVVEQLSALRVLLVASRGIFEDFYAISQYRGKYFDKVMTNSTKLACEFKRQGVESELFNFYFIALSDSERNKIDTKYQYDNVFLGMGFGRLTDPEYATERSIFFDSNKLFNFGLFGNGWNETENYKGLLPPDDIGTLYSSAMSANAIIGSGQRGMGMINNRYTEIAACNCPLISYPYKIDWFGAEKFINFISSDSELNNVVLDIKLNRVEYLNKAGEFTKFIINEDKVFFEKLEKLIS